MNIVEGVEWLGIVVHMGFFTFSPTSSCLGDRERTTSRRRVDLLLVVRVETLGLLADKGLGLTDMVVSPSHE